MTHVASTLDYGCGKFRYRKAILEKTDTLCVVDSEVQLSRLQMIEGEKSSIRRLASKSNRLVALNTLEFRRQATEFDRAFCINVLSVIPIVSVRLRVLNLIHSKLRPSGECLFVVQYRNSDFTRMQRLPNAETWGDGFLINSLRGYSFYGLIRPEKLTEMVAQAGFEISDVTLNEGSAYVLARNPA